MEKFAERLVIIRNKLGMTQSELANALGIPRSSISNIESQDRNISSSIQEKLLSKLNVSLNWLISGHGEPFLDTIKNSNNKGVNEGVNEGVTQYSNKKDEEKEEANILEKFNSLIDELSGFPEGEVVAKEELVPFITTTTFVSESPELPEGFNATEFLITKRLKGCDLAFPIPDYSMEGKYNYGDIVACKEVKDKSIIVWGEPYLVILQDYRLVKYIQPAKEDPTKVRLVSQHQDYEDITIKKDTILKLYHIKGKAANSSS